MTVAINEKTVGIWIAPLEEGNITLHLGYIEGDNYEIIFRIRWYAEKQSLDPFDGSDKKSAWLISTNDKSREQAIERARCLIKGMIRDGRKPIELLNNGTLEEFVFKLAEQKQFIHMRTER